MRQKCPVTSIQFSADGKLLASGSSDNSIRLWDVDRQIELGVLGEHTEPVFSVHLCSNGRLLASGSSDKNIYLWDVMQPKKAGVLRGHEENVYTAQFSADGKLLASGSSEKAFVYGIYRNKKKQGYYAVILGLYIPFNLVLTEDYWLQVLLIKQFACGI